MPSSGSATYRGTAQFSDEMDVDEILDDPDAASTIRMNANFRQNTITGELENFRNDDNERVPGVVRITSGRISGNGVRGQLSGDLTVNGERQRVRGQIEGQFVGNRPNGVLGGIAGTVGGEPVYGVFSAER